MTVEARGAPCELTLAHALQGGIPVDSLLSYVAQAQSSLGFAAKALWSIAPFFLLSVLAAAWTKATGLDRQIARVFDSRPLTAVFLAAVFGEGRTAAARPAEVHEEVLELFLDLDANEAIELSELEQGLVALTEQVCSLTSQLHSASRAL